MATKVLVVTHKEYPMPDKDIYFPMCVGVGIDKLKDQYQPDNEGVHISDKNGMYSELTALYWAWKNLNCDILGLVHYRRHLTINKGAKKLEDAIDGEQVEQILSGADAIVSKRRIYVETVKGHYINCERGQRQKARRRLEILSEVIKEQTPEYSKYFDKVMRGFKAHMFNIFIMKKHHADAYCKWLFDILFEAERRIDAEGVNYSRGMGELSEFLLDVWLQCNHLKCYDADMIVYGYSFWAKTKFVVGRRLFGKAENRKKK